LRDDSFWGWLSAVNIAIRLLRTADLRAAGQHIERHAGESGRDGDIVFAPFSEFDRDAYEASRFESWRRAVDLPGWERCWGALHNDRIIGHLDLTGGHLYSGLHRARLGIGVERTQRGLGVGSALLQAAIRWSRQERDLLWIDLSVFAHNERARRLYEKLGFVEIGRTADAYRMGKQSIDDVHMTLRIA
jgi:RimJ/RimL family protein N-acetyltransferase